jgi:hypothetical protein
MRIRGVLFCAALLLCGVTSASATMRISDDRGGQINEYLQFFAALRTTGEPVVVDGDCLSACTLVLGMIPRNQICATPHARFGFHTAWTADLVGNVITDKPGTRALWRLYPLAVRRWIVRHGGLSHQMTFLEGRELEGIVAICERPNWRANLGSHRDYPSHPAGYISARAAKDRR